MARQANQKLKILYLRQMLLDETDDDHGLTMAEIIDRLAEHGIAAERKAIYRDLDSLRDFGMEIIKRSRMDSGVTEYAVGKREFEFPELLLLVDAVQSSRFLTERKSLALVNHIGKLASRHQADMLAGRVHVQGRIKMQNESIYYNVNDIQQAIARRRKIAFRYLSYDIDKQSVARKGGKVYRENPLRLIYHNEFYYVVTYNDCHESFLKYCVDRMRNIKIEDEPVTRNAAIATFNLDEYVSQSFSMYNGASRMVELLADPELVGAIIDRFGREVQMSRAEDGRARVSVRVMVSGAFFGWLAQFGARAVISAPSDVAVQYRDYLQSIVDQYEQ